MVIQASNSVEKRRSHLEVAMARLLRNTAILSVLLSLVVHCFFLVGLVQLDSSAPLLEDKKSIEITVLDNSLPSPTKAQQVVEQDKALNEELPEEAKYLGRFNQKVIKETRATQSGKLRNGQTAKKGRAKENQASTPPPTPPQATAKTSKLSGTLPTLAQLRPKFDPLSLQKRSKKSNSGASANQTSDYLRDTDKGLETLLNTREFLYYSYYQRIREKIRQQWEPKIRAKVAKIFAQGRTIASAQDRVTRVIIILNEKGSLVKVQVVGQSGITDLDDAAVEAFRAAEPFPNPPKGIIENDQRIRIRWDFILEAQHQQLDPSSNKKVARR